MSYPELNLQVFEQFPVLRSTRLLLREIRTEDAPRIYDMRSNGHVNRFIARPAMDQEEKAKVLAEKTRQAYDQKQAIGWAGILRKNESIIGTCGYNSIDFLNRRAEIGGELSVEFWGKNIAIEAVSLILEFGLHTFGLHTIEAKVSPDNRGAIYLMEQLGFRKEAHYRDRILFQDRFLDMAVYTLIKGEEKLFRP